MVVAVWLVVLGISQPPLAAVACLPHLLPTDTALHGKLVASTAAFFLASHIDNQVGFAWVVVAFLAHGVVHCSPVCLAAWRPNLVSRRAGIFLSSLRHLQAVVDADEFASRVAFDVQIFHNTVLGTALITLQSWRLLRLGLAQVSARRNVAVLVVEPNIIRSHSGHMQVTVSMVVAVWLVVLGISQPPLAAVACLPHLLPTDTALHGKLVASTAAFFLASHIDNQVGFAWVVVVFLPHGVVHCSPVCLAAWRPNLVSHRAGIFLRTLRHLEAVVDADEFASRVAFDVQSFRNTVLGTALITLQSWRLLRLRLTQVSARHNVAVG